MNLHQAKNMKTTNHTDKKLFITLAIHALVIPVLIFLTGCSSLKNREARYVAGVDCARPFVEGRQDYDMALKCLDNLEHMCNQFAQDSHSSEPEKINWQERVEYIQKSRKIIVSDYNHALKQVRTLVNSRQSGFVCIQAAHDLRIAQSIADGQNGKWFNWFGLRDDPSEWAKAAVLCDRVLGDTRISHILNLAAARQKSDCDRRLGNKGRAIYAKLNALPDYNSINGFPTFREEEIIGSAKKIWSQGGASMPLFKEDSLAVGTPIGKGNKNAGASH